MSKILIIPDVHGSHEWEIAKDKISLFDYVVFMGDYFDSWENKWDDQGNNFKNICEFKRANFDKVKLLIGNHDFSYITGTRDGDKVSGHQYNKAGIIRALLNANSDILDLAFENDDWVFSHAGFSNTWISLLKKAIHFSLDKYPNESAYGKEFTNEKEYNKFMEYSTTPIEVWDENEFSIDMLNNFWHTRTHNPCDKNFSYRFDELLDWNGLYDPSGNEETQGILWIRPSALIIDAFYDKQIVGHTECQTDELLCFEKNGKKLVLTDSPTHKVHEFDTLFEIEFEKL